MFTKRQKFWLDASDLEAKKHTDNGLAGFFALLALPNDKEQSCDHPLVVKGVCQECEEEIL